MINMLDPEMTEDDADECLSMLVALGRAIPADRWVEEIIVANQQEAQRKNLDTIF